MASANKKMEHCEARLTHYSPPNNMHESTNSTSYTQHSTETSFIQLQWQFGFCQNSTAFNQSLANNHLKGKSNIAEVLDTLVDKGYPTDQLIFPADFELTTQLINKGATPNHFITALDLFAELIGNWQENINMSSLARLVEELIK